MHWMQRADRSQLGRRGNVGQQRKLRCIAFGKRPFGLWGEQEVDKFLAVIRIGAVRYKYGRIGHDQRPDPALVRINNTNRLRVFHDLVSVVRVRYSSCAIALTYTTSDFAVGGDHLYAVSREPLKVITGWFVSERDEQGGGLHCGGAKERIGDTDFPAP